VTKKIHCFLILKLFQSASDFVLKRKKNAKGSQSWNQFWIVYNSNDEEIFGIAWCSIHKSCFVYKKLVNGQERLMRTKEYVGSFKKL